MSPKQIPFDLPVRHSHSGEDFIVADCNRVALNMVEAYPNWPHPVLVLIGEASSGKSHLASVFEELSNAKRVSATDIPEPSQLIAGEGDAVILEDADQGVDETALFHLINWAREHEGFVLVTGSKAVVEWGLHLPDLISRLKGAPVARIDMPDEDLLRAVMMKQFSDRQLQVSDNALNYVLLRMERSFEAAGQLVEQLDQAALVRKRPITTALAREILGA
ncbi:MAG: hypothetical protein KAI28_05375 [Sphingomonadales bacterium]|nr:hypothetical protein [Sphingomonadales bacterium]